MSTELSQPTTSPQLPAKPHLIFGGLSKREYLFVDYWLADPEGNGTEAARKAGFTGTDESLWTTASRLLRRAKVQAEIRRRLGTHIASSEEVLETLTKHARADLTDVLTPTGEFSYKAARNKRLLKKLKVKKRIEHDKDGNLTEHVEQEFEIHDPQAALEKLGRFHKLFDQQSPTVAVNINLHRTDITLALQQSLAIDLDQDA
jgi:terminase small subunit-like protein